MSLNKSELKQNNMPHPLMKRHDDDDDDDEDDYDNNFCNSNNNNGVCAARDKEFENDDDEGGDNESGDDDGGDDDDGDDGDNGDDDDEGGDDDDAEDYVNHKMEKKPGKKHSAIFSRTNHRIDGYLTPNDLKSWTTPITATTTTSSSSSTTTFQSVNKNNDQPLTTEAFSSRLNNARNPRPTSDLPNDLETSGRNNNNNLTSSGETTAGSHSPPLPIIYISNLLNHNNNNNNGNNNINNGNNNINRRHKNINTLQDQNKRRGSENCSKRSKTLGAGLGKSGKAKKFGFKQCSSFAKELEDQFKASKNCHSTTPAMNFNKCKRKLLKRNLCALFSTVFCVNLIVGIAMVLMTTYIVYYKAKDERARTEIEIQRFGLKMTIKHSAAQQVGFRIIKEWAENSTGTGKTNKGSTIFVDAVQYDSSTGHFQVQVDAFYHIFSRIYFKSLGLLVKVRLKTSPGDREVMGSSYATPWCDNPTNVCQSNTLSTLLYLEKGQSFYVQVSNEILEDFESFMFVHVV